MRCRSPAPCSLPGRRTCPRQAPAAPRPRRLLSRRPPPAARCLPPPSIGPARQGVAQGSRARVSDHGCQHACLRRAVHVSADQPGQASATCTPPPPNAPPLMHFTPSPHAPTGTPPTFGTRSTLPPATDTQSPSRPTRRRTRRRPASSGDLPGWGGERMQAAADEASWVHRTVAVCGMSGVARPSPPPAPPPSNRT